MPTDPTDAERLIGKSVSRIADMHPDRELVLYRQSDGDMIVAIRERGAIIQGDTAFWPADCEAQVEFCAIGSGGGRSEHTLDALYKLIQAMHQDEQERPLDAARAKEERDGD